MKPFIAPVLIALLLAPWPALALYKVIGADGSVTYTDRPPPAAAGTVVTVRSDGSRAPDPVLPATLREPMARFPVMLYSSTPCNACDMARDLLRQRGVPFQERLASTDEDREAWVRIVGGVESPVLTIGQQYLRGFAPATWNAYLDSAGYPSRSVLPLNYALPPAAPLVARAAPPADVVQPRARALPQAAPASPASPEGIRF